jgi:hypothetical protein
MPLPGAVHLLFARRRQIRGQALRSCESSRESEEQICDKYEKRDTRGLQNAAPNPE